MGRDGAVVGAQGTLERMWVWRFYLPECCRGFLPARAEQQQLNTELETGFLFSAPLCCPLTGDESWKLLVDSDQAALEANLGGPRMNLCFDPDYGLTLVENVTNAIRP